MDRGFSDVEYWRDEAHAYAEAYWKWQGKLYFAQLIAFLES
jgi:hypothetical protein